MKPSGPVMWLVVVVLVSLPTLGGANCEHFAVTDEPQGMTTCVYETGTETEPIMMALLPGSHYLDEANCTNCTCSETILECCGYGIRAGVMNHQFCKPKMTDSCNYVMVLKENENILC